MAQPIRFPARLFNFRKPAFLLEKEKKGCPIQWIVSSDAESFKIVFKNAPEKKFNNGVNTFFIEAAYPSPPLDGLYMIEIFSNQARDGRIFNNVRVVDGPLEQKSSNPNLVQDKAPVPVATKDKKRLSKKKIQDDTTEEFSDPEVISDSESSSEEDLFDIDVSQNVRQVIRLLEKQELYHAKQQKVCRSLVAEMKLLGQQMGRMSLQRKN